MCAILIEKALRLARVNLPSVQATLLIISKHCNIV